jgi:hypothetical protein
MFVERNTAGHTTGVMRGLDPRIHHFTKRLDRRVKPGDDRGEGSAHSCVDCGAGPRIVLVTVSSARKIHRMVAGTQTGV